MVWVSVVLDRFTADKFSKEELGSSVLIGGIKRASFAVGWLHAEKYRGKCIQPINIARPMVSWCSFVYP